MGNEAEKQDFLKKLREFTASLGDKITVDGEWTIKGFIDVFRNIHTISSDTKIVSKVLELHLFPFILSFAEEAGYELELANHQNWYPDMTFISKKDPSIKYAVDIKTTYCRDSNSEYCNGFTLGSHGEYFVNRSSSKNIQYPYKDYSGHFCLGIIYKRSKPDKMEEANTYSVDDLTNIPSVIHDFIFFVEEKWKIASDKGGSGNTANIGSIRAIEDIINGNGVFAKAGEAIFDDYWMNYGKIEVLVGAESKKLTSLEEYLNYRGLPQTLNNKRSGKGKNE